MVFGRLSRRTWPRDPFQRVGLEKWCRTHTQLAPETDFEGHIVAMSWSRPKNLNLQWLIAGKTADVWAGIKTCSKISRSGLFAKLFFWRPGATKAKKPQMFRKSRGCLALPPSAERPNKNYFPGSLCFVALEPQASKNNLAQLSGSLEGGGNSEFRVAATWPFCGADFWCNRYCRTSPVVLEGFGGQVWPKNGRKPTQ